MMRFSHEVYQVYINQVIIINNLIFNQQNLTVEGSPVEHADVDLTYISS